MITLSWDYSDYFDFRLIDQASPIWAPDGKHLLLERLDAHEEPDKSGYLLNIEDGSLTKLYEGGLLLGTVQIP